MSRRYFSWLALMLSLSSLTMSVGCHPVAPKFQSTDISNSGWGQDFHLRDPQGRKRSLADYGGKAVLIFFGFIQCPDVCPTALSRAVEIKRLLGKDSQRLQVIFVTLDPERDSPPMLDEYVHAFDPSFVGLPTTLEATQTTARNFKVFYQKVPTGASYTMDHSAISYVFDPSGHLRLAVTHGQTAASVAADLRILFREKAG